MLFFYHGGDWGIGGRETIAIYFISRAVGSQSVLNSRKIKESELEMPTQTEPLTLLFFYCVTDLTALFRSAIFLQKGNSSSFP